MKRDVGSNFNKDEADKIFDALDKLDSKSTKKDKNIENQIKEVSQILKDAKSCDDAKACELYQKVLVLMPENSDAYMGLADIYHKQNRAEKEKDIIKKAIHNTDGSNKEKFMKRLKNL